MIIVNFQEVTVSFRWSPPARANGIITAYKVYCWREKDGKLEHICHDVVVAGSVTEYSKMNLSSGEIYFFSVSFHYIFYIIMYNLKTKTLEWIKSKC